MKKFHLVLLICIFAFPIKGYSQKILSSFEKQYPIKEIRSSSDVIISRSTQFPALGKYSLKVIFPRNGGTIRVGALSTGNWIRREVLLAFTWSTKPSRIHVSVTDSSGNSYSEVYHLKRGANHLQLKLTNLEEVSVKEIKSIRFEVPQTDTLYLDYFSLDRYQPRLAKIGRWDINYSNKVKTPHFSWGKPLVGGPIITYSISPVEDGRGIIELAERLDIHPTVTTIARTSGPNRWGFGAFYGRRNPSSHENGHPFALAFDYIADDLLFGPNYDVIIWPGLHKWNKYPKQIRKAILKRVRNGTGLVLLYPKGKPKNSRKGLWAVSPLKPKGSWTDKKNVARNEIWSHLDMSKWIKTGSHYITRGVPLHAFPWGHIGVSPYHPINDGKVLIKTAKGNPVLSVGKYGKGRVVAMAYPEWGLIPKVDNLWETGSHYSYWEYMWSLVARSVVWAAKCEPQTHIENVGRATRSLYADLSHVPEGASLRVRVVDSFGAFERDTTIILRPHQNRVKIQWNKLIGGGAHIVNVQLKGKKGIYDWYSLKFSVPKVAQIDSINLKKKMVHVGKKVHATVSIETDDAFNGHLIARLYDNYERLISKRTYNVSTNKGKSLNITLPSSGVMTHLAKLDLVLQTDGKQVDHNVKEVFTRLPKKSDYYAVVMYGFIPNPIPGTWPLLSSQLKNLHVTTLSSYTFANSKHANFKIQAQTRISGVESPDSGPRLKYYRSMKSKYLKTHNKMILIRKPGLRDPAYLHKVQNELERMIFKWRKFSPSAYYIYEEPSFTRYDDALDLSFSKRTLKAMWAWLKTQYWTLDALNREWGTNFKQWRDVIPDDSYEAQKRGNYASWADHRTFMEKTWADFMKFVQKTTHKYDPKGVVLLSGTQVSSPFNGYDYSRIDKYVDQMNAYNIGEQLYFHHNFNPDLRIFSGAGYGALGKDVLSDYYNNLFLGGMGTYIFWQLSALRPDLAISKSGMMIKKGFDEIKGKGIGKLVSAFTPANENHIAIEYSMPSIHGSWIVDGSIMPRDSSGPASKTFQQFRRDREGWVNILKDAGLGFDFISYSSIENGGLITKGYKVLILPMSVALSDREVKQIKYFVQQGGILIADALPGIMDGHCKFREKRALAKVFGIEPRRYSRERVVTPKHETGLKLDGAHYIIKEEGVPELLYHKYGQGTAILLNYFLDEYPQKKLTGNNVLALKKFKRVLRKTNIKPKIKLTDSSGQPVMGITKFAFTTSPDNTRLLGLLPGENSTVKTITIHLDKVVNLYDIRNGTYLGKDRVFRIKVQPENPVLLGLTKRKIDHISVNAPSKATLGNQINVSFHISGKALPSLHSVAHVDVFNPNGKKIPLYSGNYSITNSSARFQFRTALNDPPGRWKIRITEAISGITKAFPVIIQKESR